jgi:hypothetical protein
MKRKGKTANYGNEGVKELRSVEFEVHGKDFFGRK